MLRTGHLAATLYPAAAAGSPIAVGVLRLLGHEMPDSADVWRVTWGAAWIDCDPVSSRVLVLNLKLAGNAACVRMSQAAGPEPL